MTAFNATDFANELNDKGTVLIPAAKGFLSEQELMRLETLADSLPTEHVQLGDADEPNLLYVGRFMTDVNHSQIVNEDISTEALLILASKEKMDLYCQLLGKSELFLRRMQYNIMERGSFIGLHLDVDSNPDYLVAVVIQFGDEYEGGEFVLHKHGKKSTYKSEKYDVIISDCLIPHEVKKIKAGHRKSLVFFLSENSGANRRYSN